jgi:AcrR family transcriptional regulator
MTRSVRPDRLWNLVDVAAEVFIAQGYRRTQMEDVADALGVAKGTVYGCVESKAALFDAAVTFADDPQLLPGPETLPLRTPPPGATLAKLRLRLAEGVRDLTLAAALKSGRPDHPAAEFSAIVHDLYRRLGRNRRTIKIVDRCALDQPELAALWFGEGRQIQQAALARYLEGRISEGLLRPLPNTEIAARVMLETIVFWAVHRHWDPEPQKVSEDQIPSVLADLLLHGLAREHM